MLRRGILAAVLGSAAIAGTAGAAGPEGQYAIPIGPDYQTTALLSVGDTVPETSDPDKDFQMVGIPDGIGGERSEAGITLYLNHELTNSTSSEPVIGDPLNRGSFVSKLTLDETGQVLSGERAYDTVFVEDTLVGPAADATNATPAFSRFCSGSLAGAAHGFDRSIYFTNEESTSGTFDPAGGQTVAIFDDELHVLPELGRFAKENSLPQPRSDRRTVIMSLEDGPNTPDSQLYMYVGRKSSSGTVLERNGLVGGKLYVFVSLNRNKSNEGNFANGGLLGRWVAIPDAEAKTAAELEEFSDSVGAFGFVRIEDGAFSKTSRHRFFFVTTGDSQGLENKLGRLYHLTLNPIDPRLPAFLRVVYNADEIVAAGGDIAISPDNLDVSERYLMINEDGTASSRPVMLAKGREGSVWRFDLNSSLIGSQVGVGSAVRVAELEPPGRDGIPVPVPGTWETSGIIDAEALFGANTWVFDVQAHSPTTPQGTNTVEDGQLLLLSPTS